MESRGTREEQKQQGQKTMMRIMQTMSRWKWKKMMRKRDRKVVDVTKVGEVTVVKAE